MADLTPTERTERTNRLLAAMDPTERACWNATEASRWFDGPQLRPHQVPDGAAWRAQTVDEFVAEIEERRLRRERYLTKLADPDHPLGSGSPGLKAAARLMLEGGDGEA